MNICAAAVAAYLYFHREEEYNSYHEDESETGTSGVSIDKSSNNSNSVEQEEIRDSLPEEPGVKKDTIEIGSGRLSSQEEQPGKGTETNLKKASSNESTEKTSEESPGVAAKVQYTVMASKAYFHNKPDERTRRNAFINPWNKVVLTPLDDQNGFIYIVYTNHLGRTSKGWLRKKDLKPLK